MFRMRFHVITIGEQQHYTGYQSSYCVSCFQLSMCPVNIRVSDNNIIISVYFLPERFRERDK